MIVLELNCIIAEDEESDELKNEVEKHINDIKLKIGDNMNIKDDIKIEIKNVSEEYGQYWAQLTASYKSKNFSDLLNEEEMKKLGNELETAFEVCPYQKWELKGGSFILELPSAFWSFSEAYDKEDAEDIINEYRNICASAILEVE